MRQSLFQPGVGCTLGVLFCCALFGDIFRVPAAKAEASNSKKSKRSEEFFADRTVRLFQIELSDAAIDSLRRGSRQYVSGIVREGDVVFPNVGIHLKGMGSFQPLEQKPSFVLKFDEYRPDQEYCGLTKLMLNNSIQDTSYLSELLATRLFRDAGVPAARVTHARVTLNGRNLGLYVAIEAMNKRFLKRHFKDGKGNLYEGYLQDINTRLDQDNGEQKNQSDVRALLAACKTVDLSERFQRLDHLLDIERFASFAAMEMLIAHWDGYTLHTNNYRFYHDPGSGKIVFIAHGLDSVFRRPNISIQPPMKSIVSRALFQTPEGLQRYEKRLADLFTNVFRLETISNRMEEALSKLRAADLPGEKLLEIERQAGIMRTRVARRVARVGEALSGIEPSPLPFDASGLARLDGWRTEFDHGEPVFDRPIENGLTLLHIKASGGRCRASWRTMVYLKPGRYRFEGRLRTEGVTGGTGLRISGDTRNMRLSGQNSWRGLQHEFRVEEGAGDVELVCEFDARAGESWFELESLCVRKL